LLCVDEEVESDWKGASKRMVSALSIFGLPCVVPDLASEESACPWIDEETVNKHVGGNGRLTNV
jgi:hypothetical protein